MTFEGFMKADTPGPGKEHRSPSCGSLADMGSVAWALVPICFCLFTEEMSSSLVILYARK